MIVSLGIRDSVFAIYFSPASKNLENVYSNSAQSSLFFVQTLFQMRCGNRFSGCRRLRLKRTKLNTEKTAQSCAAKQRKPNADVVVRSCERNHHKRQRRNPRRPQNLSY